MSQKLSKILLFMTILLWAALFALVIVASEFKIFIYVLLGINIVFTLTLLILNRKNIWLFLKSRLFKHISYHIINLFLVMSILGLINFLVLKNDQTFDLTLNKIHTLSAQSVNALKQLSNRELKLKIFAARGTWDGYRNLFNLYKQKSKNISVTYYDIEEELSLVEYYKIKENGTLVIEDRGQIYKTVAVNELAVTNLLLKISNPITKVLYYTVGHNELALSDKNNVGADYLREKILESKYKLKPLQLQNGVPSDAAAVLVFNPQIEFLDDEIKALKKYLEQGGSLLATLSPYFNGVITKNFMRFLNSIGIDHVNGIILDRLAAQQGAQASTPVVNFYKEHPITKNFEGRTLYPISSFIQLKDGPYQWKKIVTSTPFPATWGEVNFDEVKLGKAAYNEGLDYEGPLNIIVAGEDKRDSRVLISASTSFISNQFKGQTNNFNLFLNSLSWLARDEALMSLNRPSLKGNIIYVSDIHLSFVFYLVICVVPFIYFGLGIYFYRKKMNS